MVRHKFWRSPATVSVERCLLLITEVIIQTAFDSHYFFLISVGKLDHLACDQLEKLETRYPLITKPTDEVYDTAIKPTVEQVNATIKPSVDAYKSAKQYGTDTVS